LQIGFGREIRKRERHDRGLGGEQSHFRFGLLMLSLGLKSTEKME
jgi:hypothetical protein